MSLIESKELFIGENESGKTFKILTKVKELIEQNIPIVFLISENKFSDMKLHQEYPLNLEETFEIYSKLEEVNWEKKNILIKTINGFDEKTKVRNDHIFEEVLNTIKSKPRFLILEDIISIDEFEKTNHVLKYYKDNKVKTGYYITMNNYLNGNVDLYLPFFNKDLFNNIYISKKYIETIFKVLQTKALKDNSKFKGIEDIKKVFENYTSDFDNIPETIFIKFLNKRNINPLRYNKSYLFININKVDIITSENSSININNVFPTLKEEENKKIKEKIINMIEFKKQQKSGFISSFFNSNKDLKEVEEIMQNQDIEEILENEEQKLQIEKILEINL